MPTDTQQQAFAFPLSYAQQRLWFLDQYEGSSATYNISMALRLEGPLQITSLEEALNAVIARHETLRTTFRMMDKQPVQIVHPHMQVSIPTEDLTHILLEERLSKVGVRVGEEARRPFDLTTGPLIRMKIFRLGMDDHVLHVNLHHIISDGWSMDILVRDLISVYQSRLKGEAAALPELEIQYVDFTQWQREWLSGEVLESKLAYWKEKLNGVPGRLDLPTDRTRPAFMTFRGRMKTFEIGQELRDQLEDIGHTSRTTLFMTLLSAFAGLISFYTREEDVVIASPIANRNRPEIEPLIGFFVNTLPLRIKLDGNPQFTAVLRQVEQTCLEAYKHQDMPFEKLVNDLGLTRDMSRAPLAQVAFAHQNVHVPDIDVAGLKISDFEVQTGTAKTDLVVMMEETPRGLRARVEYNTDLFEEATIDEIMGGYIRLLHSIVDHPGHDLGTLVKAAGLRDLKDTHRSPEDTAYAGYLSKSNLTENQLHLWLGQKLIGDNPLYNLKTLYTLNEPVDPVYFQRAFQKIIDTNENFRTVFYEEEGIPYQKVLDHLDYEMPFLDFSQEGEPLAAARAWVEGQASRVFDLTAPSFHSVLIKLAEDKYQWYMSQHHILTDGWSLHLTYNQLTEFYRAALEDRLETVAPRPQFRDYVRDEHDFRQSPRYRKAMDYWNGVLADRPEQPTFYGSAPKRQSTAIQRMSRPREGDLIARINALNGHPQLAGIAEHTLKYNFFLALYALFISRISGRNRISIGVPIHNRRSRDHVDIQGLFMHIVPLVIDVDPGQTLIDLMQQIKRITFNAMKHGQYVVRNSPRDPAYDVLFNYQMWRLPNFHYKAFELEWLHSGHTFESCGLQVHDFEKEVRTGGERLNFDFEFKRELFDEPTRERAIGHFFTLMDAALVDISQPMRQLSMLPEEETHTQINVWNRTAAAYPKDRCVHQLFEEQVKRTPDRIAVTCGENGMTYAELNAAANKVARRLIAAGVGANRLVGICCRPDLDMMVGLLGILKSGAAYVPVDPAYPADRLAAMLSAANLSAMIVHDKTAECQNITGLCLDRGCRLVSLDRERDAIASLCADNPGASVSPTDLMYTIFTSGSTGTPKAAGVYHRGAVNLLTWFTKTFELSSSDSVLVISSLSFDLTQKNLFAPLLVGGSLHLNDECYFDPGQIVRRVAATGATWLNCTPSAFYPLHDQAAADQYASFRSLRWVFLGGEPISLMRLQPWLSSVECGYRLVNSYGPTECTDVTTFHVLSTSDQTTGGVIPIGRPIANTQHFVLDEDLNLQPCGVPGELCIAGDGVGAGYFRDPELTARKFVPNPFGQGRLYRTGDIVRARPDGTLEFIGRRDEQVKIRGFRIELGDITAALNRLPCIKESVVVALDDKHGGKMLAAYVVAGQENVTPAVIQQDLKAELPDYMIPGSITVLKTMPLTPNGKIDRKALPDPAQQDIPSHHEYVEARNEVEEKVCRMWREVIGVPRIGVYDNFFDLGGHSLMATQIMAMIREEFQVEVPVRALFEAPTVAGVCEAIAEYQGSSDITEVSTIGRADRNAPIPLSYGQEHIWVMDNMTDDKATFNMPVALRVTGELDTDCLQRVLDEIMARHEILRTTVRMAGADFRQEIRPAQGMPFELIDIRHLPDTERSEYERRFVLSEARRRFDLTSGPVIRAYLLQSGPTRNILIINVHHIAFDAFSAHIILTEIGALYRAFAQGHPSPLEPLRIQYADYAVWQRDHLQGDSYREKLRRWQQRLRGASPTLALPTDNPRPAVQTYNGTVHRFRFDRQTVAALEELGRSHSATLYMTLLTVFAAVLSQLCEEDDIVLSSPVAGRNRQETAGMIGLFVNLLPLRVDIGGNPVFSELITRVREVCLETQADQDVTFDHIVAAADVPHDPGRSPFSQVVFNVQHAPDDQFQVEGLNFEPVEYAHETANTDLAVIMDQDRSGGIKGVVEYNTDLFRPETVERIMAGFARLVGAAIRRPQDRLAALFDSCGLDPTRIRQSHKDKDPFGYYLEHSNLTGHQLILWAGQQLDKANPIYNSTITYRIPEPIDIGHFRRAFQAVVDGRDALRTVVRMADGIPQRHVVDRLEYNVIFQDFSTEPDPPAAAAEWIQRQGKTAFALEQCLFCSALIKIAKDDFIWFISQHHIITDGWSQALMYRTMSDYYRQSLAGEIQPPEFPQFETYAAHERAYRGSSRESKDAAYWQNILNQPKDPLTFYGRPPVKTGTDMVRMSRRLGEQVTQQILDFTAHHQSERSTAEAVKFNLFLTVFAIYLWRISGKKTFNIGIPLHNRRGKDMKDVMGLLMRVVPLRIEIDPEDTPSGLMAKIKRGSFKAMQHGQYLINNNHQDPVYDVLLNFHTWKGATFHTKPLTVEWIHPMQAYESLALNVHDMERELEGRVANIQIDFDFHRDVFDQPLQERALSHFCRLISVCLQDPARPVKEISLLSDDERQRILHEWNDTAMPLPATSIHRIIEDQAKQTPRAEALRYEGTVLSYEELNQRANRLAHWLRDNSVGPDSLVGISMERSLEMVIGLLGIVKAGGAYVPIDPSYPADRIAFMLEDSGVKLLLTQDRLLPRLPDHDARTLCLDTQWEQVAGFPADNPAGEVNPDDLAYMIYTSGSTGKPKGALNSHKAILNRLVWMQKEYGLDADDKIIQKTPFSFDVSVWEFFWPLMYGATLVIARPEGHKDSAYLRDLIKEEGITTLHFVPSMLQIFLEEEGIEELTSIKRVICSGEALSTEVQSRFFRRLKAGLHNLYGPTEAAIDVTYWACRPDDERHTVPIGRPVANTQIYILDEDLKPVPVGVAGELHISGIQLARGYHNRPELTAEKFIPDPFCDDPQARLYKTGDLACFGPDGIIEFLGRIDHQVKIRGFRIELGEIEAALQQYPGVTECVVVAHKDPGGHTGLAAYVVVNGGPPAVEDVREFLLGRLPDYMVPSIVMFLDAMPLSPNGKLDRRALPQPEATRTGLRREYTAPRNELETRLAAIFRELLDVDRVGIHDGFFELGGHSLQAIRLIARVRSELNVDLPLRVFFESSNIAELSVKIEEARLKQSQRPDLRLTAVPRDRRLPLAFTQKRLWILDKLEPGSSAYNMPTAIGIKGPFRAELFERIFNAIIARHEILRTNFAEENGQPYLVIKPELTIAMPVRDLRDLPAEQRRAEAWRLATAEAAKPFDLTRGPLVRAQALRLEDDDHVLMFTTHHIITDGWSIAVFVDEIQQLYTAFSSNLPSPLPDLALQFADYAYWQNEWFKGEDMRAQLEYWQNKMDGAPALLDLPTDRVRPAIEGHAGTNVGFTIDAELTAALKGLANSFGVTLFMLLHAVFLMLLSRYSRQEDIVLGTPTANRNFTEVEPLIGFFVNTLLLRVDLSGDPTFAGLLERVKQTDIEAFEQQQVPFEHLLETLKPERSLSYSPFFQVLFVLQNTPPWDSRQIKDLEFSDFGYDMTSAKFDISMDLREDDGALEGLVQYKTDLFEPQSIQRMIDQFRRLLAETTRDPRQRISAYRLTDDRERSRLLEEWNRTDADYPRDKCIHQLFEEQARRTPEAVAVRHTEQTMTYAELNRRANVLAHLLRGKGVVPGVFVGICIERSIEMIISLLAVLKAGGAYVPLDPDYPTERLQYMIDDTGLSVLLTSHKIYGERSLMLHDRVDPVCVDKDWALIEQEYDAHGTQPPNGYPLNSSNLAYVIYTSGSTGQPKGVLIEHRSLVNYACWAQRAYGVTQQDRFLQFSSINFDAAGEEIYTTLISGATLVLRTDDMIDSASNFFDLCDKWGITVLQTPTAYWHQLVTDLNTDSGIALPEQLRLFVIGGERALPEKVRQWHRRVGDRPALINGYGPTETTIASTYMPLSAPSSDTCGLREVPIGRPIANTQVFILDEQLKPVPVGIPGELYIGGDGLARGYLNQEQLNAQRFAIIDLEGLGPRRLYRTGDICRYLPDGMIEYRGRADDQVKIRGFRIELGEIETVLARHPDVAQCAVLVKDASASHKQLIAYVATSKENIGPTELRAFLKERLPNYMVPAAYLVLDNLPLTGAGKINRQALLKMDVEQEILTNYIPPRDAVERKMAELWQGVLGIERVGIHDNFFELGGHSLIATQLVSRIVQEFGVTMPLLQLFQGPTVAAMCAYVRQREGAPVDPAQRIVAVNDRPAKIPVTRGQARLWMIEQENPGLPTYNMPAAFHIRGDFQIDVLRRVVAEMLRRHESLRTSFTQREGEICQIIHANVPDPVEFVDLRAFPEHERDAQAVRMTAEEKAVPFDLTVAPLLRVRVFQVRDQEFMLTVVMHHIISDGWSVDIITREIAVLYECFVNDRPSILPDLPVQFADFTLWQAQYRRSPEYQRQVEYWRRQMAGAPELMSLRTDFPRPEIKTFKGDNEDFVIDAAVIAEVRRLCQECGVTLHMVLTTVLAIVMRLHGAQEDMVIATSVARRNRREVEDLIGLLTNNVCLRLDLSGEPTFSELLGRVSKVCLDAYANQDVAISEVIDITGVEKRRDYQPLYQVTMVLQNNSANTGWTLPEQNLQIMPAPDDAKKAKYDLTIGFEEVEGGLEARFNYSTDIFKGETVRRMTQEFIRIIRRAVTDPHMPISAMDTQDHASSSAADEIAVTAPSAPSNQRETSNLVVIQPAPEQPPRQYPLFCIHPVGGNVFCYMNMARHFGPRQPLYGLQSVGVEGRDEPLQSVEDMADYYLKAVTSVQPAGPYHLLGWSFGGVVAYEMACRLKAQGGKVALVAMIDTFVPSQHKYRVFSDNPDDGVLLGYLIDHLEGMFGCPLNVNRAELAKQSPDDQLRHVLDRAHQAGVLPDSFTADQMRSFFNVYKANHLAFCRYQARPYDGNIKLFCPKKQLFVVGRANIHSWNKLTNGRVDVCHIPGDHYTIMQRTNSTAIAMHLREYIATEAPTILETGEAL